MPQIGNPKNSCPKFTEYFLDGGKSDGNTQLSFSCNQL